MTTLTTSLVMKLIDGVTAPARGVATALRGVRGAIAGVNSAPIGAGLGEAMRRNAAALDRSRSRMVEAAAGIYTLRAALTAPLTSATMFETTLEDIGQKAEIPQDRLSALGLQIRKTAREVNRGGLEMAKGVDTLLGLGAKEGDAMGLIAPIGRAATAYRAAVEDLARAGFASLDNLKVAAGDFPRVLDAMASAGKAGAFELRDMAQYFPSLTASYQALRQTGVPAVADLAAALQIARKGAGDSAEAATNLGNVLQKIQAPATRKKFAEMGVNLEAELKKAAKKGMTPIEAIAEITNRALKGNLGRLGDLFEDAQVQKGLRPLIQNMEEYRRVRKDAIEAQGVVASDYERRLKTSAAATMRWNATLENLSVTIGAALLPALNDLLDSVSPAINAFATFSEANPKLTAALVGTTAALVGLRIAGIAAGYGLRLAAAPMMRLAVVSAFAWRAIGKSMLAPILLGRRAAGGLKAVRGALLGSAAASRTASAATIAAMSRSDQALSKASKSAKAASAVMIAGMSGSKLAAQQTSRAMVAGMVRSSSAIRMAAGGGILAGLARGFGGVARAIRSIVPATAVARGALALLKVALITTGVGALIVGIGSAAAFVYRNWTGTTKAVSAAGKALKDALGPAGPLFDSIAQSVSGLVKLFDDLTGPIDDATWIRWGESVGKTVGETARQVLEFMRDIRQATSDPIGYFFKPNERHLAAANAEGGLSDVADESSRIDAVGAKLRQAWADLWKGSDTPRGPALAGGAAEGLDAEAAGIDAAGARLRTAWDGVVTWASGLKFPPLSSVLELPDLAGSLSAAGDAARAAWSGFAAWWGGLKLPPLSSVLELPDLAGSISAAGDAARATWNSFAAWWGGLNLPPVAAPDVAALRGGLAFAAEQATAILSSLRTTLRDAFANVDLSGAGRAVMESLGRGLASAWSGVSSWVGGLAARISDAFVPATPAAAGVASELARSYTPPDLAAAGRSAIESFSSGMAAAWGAATAWLGSLSSAVTSAVGSIDLSSVGANAIASLLAGMRSRMGEVLAFAATVRAQVSAATSGAGAAVRSAPPVTPAAPTPAGIDGARRKGGPVWEGGTFWVGEEGPEIFKPAADGEIIPASESRAAASAGAGRPAAASVTHFAPNVSVHVTGSRASAEEIAEVVERKLRDLARGSYADADLRPA